MPSASLKLSVVVIGYNNSRELPRTILSLLPPLQRDVHVSDYEIIIVDNGSQDFDKDQFMRMGTNIQAHALERRTHSSVPAINHGLAVARGELICVMPDGARLASPRVLATALDAAGLSTRPVIGAHGFHLGPDLQMRSAMRGYCQEVEDRLLDAIDWTSDPYRLFEISVFSPASSLGWSILPSETCALFLTRSQWNSLGGYDERFVSEGGGVVNFDTWQRACADPDARIFVLLGEGMFHQIHGGVTSSAGEKPELFRRFHEEYVRIRGTDPVRSRKNPFLIGQLHPAALANLARTTKLDASRLPESNQQQVAAIMSRFL